MKTHVIHSKHLCAHRQTQRALFNTRSNPNFRARNDHDLCSRCHRSYQAMLRRWSRENTLDGWML